jgi:hypothetical protein
LISTVSQRTILFDGGNHRPHAQDVGGNPTETPFAGSKEDLSFQEALSTLAHAARHSVGRFEQALMTGIHRTENESSLRSAESIADELLSGNRNREPEVARHLLDALASRGLPRSILNLATSLTLGDGGPKDETRATDLLEQLVESASTPDDLKRIAKSRLGPPKHPISRVLVQIVARSDLMSIDRISY